MSGGCFNYSNDSVCNEIFGWRLSPDYGERGFSKSAAARRMNPLGDRIISELVFDVFCLLHSFDWYKSGDTEEEDYLEDVKFFKKKWLKPMSEARVRAIVDEEFRALWESLCKDLVFSNDTKEETPS